MNTPALPNPRPSHPEPVHQAPSSEQPVQVLEAVDPLQSVPDQASSVPLAAPSALPVVPVLPLQPRRRGRRGKIARLPRDLRDMVNRMLRNNLPYRQIVNALDEYEIKVTERNISNWKTFGGYKEWCLAEDHALELRMHQDNLVTLLRKDNATEVPEVGLQVAATRLSEFFLTSEAAQLLSSNPEEYQRRVANLARLTAEIQKLQRYRDDNSKELGYKHNPEHTRRENEKDLEEIRRFYSSTPPSDQKGRSIPHRNYLPKDP